MNRSYPFRVLSLFIIMSCVGILFMQPMSMGTVAHAEQPGETLEEEVTSRSIRGARTKSSLQRSRVMKKSKPSSQSSSANENQQLQALQEQVNVLQAQVNALRAVIQIANGTTTVQSKHIRLHGETIVVKSVKDGVTIESKKDLRLESKKDMTIKANSKVQMDAGSTLNMKGNGMTSIRGAMIKFNNGSKPVARHGSNTLTSPGGGPGKITSGSPTVMVP